MRVCDNAGSGAGRGLGVPGCYRGEATETIEIVYYDHGAWGETDVQCKDSDIVNVCRDCAPRVVDLAERHGYEAVIHASA